jgi:hypothetical protein
MRRGFLADTMAALVISLGLAGCVKQAPIPAPPIFPYAADAPKVFYATGSGLSEMTFQGEAETELPASRAPNASVLSSNGKSIAIAVNGWGIERIESSPDGRAYRIVDYPLPAVFSGLATGGAWPMGGGFLVQLYRDPFSDSSLPGAPSSVPVSLSRLAYFGGDGGAATTPNPFPQDVDPAYELFALLPAGGIWFAELRKDASERVDYKFFALGDPLARSPSTREVGRREFESSLKPLSWLEGDAGASLRSALALLGKGPWLTRLRSDSGEDRWYLSSGKAEEAANAFAWTLSGAVVGMLVLCPDGKLAVSGGRGEPSLTSLAAPVEGAVFTAIAAAGNIAVAAWEAGEFPYISSAGIVLIPIR